MCVSISVYYWQNAMPSSASSAPQQFLNYRYTNRTWHHDQLMLGIFSSSKSIFILKRNSVTENVQLTLESYLRLAKFLLLSREEYWSFKNTILDIRWVYLSMEEWVQTTRASSQITFFKYLLTVYRHLDLSQKQNKKNQIDWLFFRGLFDGYILWNFKQNSSRIPSNPSYSVHFLSSFSFLSLFWMLFNSKFLLLLSWINVSIWLIELT